MNYIVVAMLCFYASGAPSEDCRMFVSKPVPEGFCEAALAAVWEGQEKGGYHVVIQDCAREEMVDGKEK